MLLGAYQAISIPLMIAFQVPMPAEGSAYRVPDALLVLSYLIDLAFWADVALQFRTSFIGDEDDGNELVTSLSLIAHRYIHSALARDVATIFPLEMFAAGAENGLAGLAAQACRLNRLLHVARLWYVHGVEIGKLSRPKRLSLMLGYWSLLAHWVACCWWGLGAAGWHLSEEDNPATSRMAARAMWTVGPTSFSTREEPTALDDESPFGQRYLSALYWSLTALYRVPWIEARTSPEIAFTVRRSLSEVPNAHGTRPTELPTAHHADHSHSEWRRGVRDHVRRDGLARQRERGDQHQAHRIHQKSAILLLAAPED